MRTVYSYMHEKCFFFFLKEDHTFFKVKLNFGCSSKQTSLLIFCSFHLKWNLGSVVKRQHVWSSWNSMISYYKAHPSVCLLTWTIRYVEQLKYLSRLSCFFWGFFWWHWFLPGGLFFVEWELSGLFKDESTRQTLIRDFVTSIWRVEGL